MIRIMLPSRGRVGKLEALIPMLTASLVEDVKLYIIQDDKDAQVRYKHHPQLHVVYSATIGFWRVLNDWMVYSGNDEDPFIWLADDISPRDNWLTIGLAEWERRFPDGLGLLVFNDMLARNATAAFAMTTPMWLYVLFGYPRFPEHILHYYVDTIVSDRSKDLGKYYFCENAVVEHLHHSSGKSNMDDTYRRNNVLSRGSQEAKGLMDREWRSGGLQAARERMLSFA